MPRSPGHASPNQILLLIFPQLRITVAPKTDDKRNTQCNTCHLQNKYKCIFPDFLVYSRSVQY